MDKIQKALAPADNSIIQVWLQDIDDPDCFWSQDANGERIRATDAELKAMQAADPGDWIIVTNRKESSS
jgi:hypothetical protein